MESEIDIEKLIKRDSNVTQMQHKDGDAHVFYRVFFIGKNFYVYRYVTSGCLYHGNKYDETGYAFAWSDIAEYPSPMMPQFVCMK